LATYTNRVTVKLQDTDAAGILFFTNQLVFAHETYEKFMEDIDCSLARVFEQCSYHIPLVHAEADYAKPVTVGDEIDVEMTVANIGKTSFTLDYSLTGTDGAEIGRCRTVHVTVGKSDMKKIPLPTEIREGLERYYESS
jgi:1,4-dihydroxy-2-naphthoyl-CoA hydrolase